jgi:hypothetical protein
MKPIIWMVNDIYLLYIYRIKGAYWISSNSSFIQYCDSNIGLFYIAPPLVIALPTIATAIVVALLCSFRR